MKMVMQVVVAVLAAVALAGTPPAEAEAQASPAGTFTFSEGFSKLWGPQHQSVAHDQTAVNLTLDRSSGGSGFKSKLPYRNGYFGVSIKVQPGNTTGVSTAFFLSNSEEYPGGDEISVEVLGGVPSTLRTNVRSGGTTTGREMLSFRLSFDPAAAFHRYAVLWNPDEVVFLVDDAPVRRYQKKAEPTFPAREMWAYGCVWSTAAADYGPFTSGFQAFRMPTAAHRRRGLVGSISYSALTAADRIPCSKATGTEANCRPGGGKPAAPYTRGCTYIQQCARNIN